MKKHDLWRITLDTNPEDCNLSCTMCEEHSPHSDFMEKLYRETGVKHRRMPSDWLDAIFRQAAELGVREIIPSTMGEPLGYRHIDKIIDLCNEHGILMNLTTNGSFPSKSATTWAQRIVPVTSDVKISWNGATAATAESIMQGINFEKAIQNVRDFVAVRNRHHDMSGHYCRVTFQLTFMENNMHELADIVRLAVGLGVDRVKGHHLWAHFDEIKNLSFRRDKAAAERWNNYVLQAIEAQQEIAEQTGKTILLENIIPLKEKEASSVPTDYECPFLGREIWISATGQYAPCCAPDEQRRSLGDFGNFQQQSIQDVLESEPYQFLLRNYKTQQLCSTCTMRKPTDANRSIKNLRDASKFNNRLRPGLVFRSAACCFVSPAEDVCNFFQKNNINTVVDLRAARELAEISYTAEHLGDVQHVHVPFDPWEQSQDFQKAHSHLTTHSVIAYYFFLKECKESMKAVFSILAETSAPLLIHCHAGKDRTGIVFTLLHLLSGTNMESIQFDYLASEMDTRPELLDIVLNEVEKLGGIEPYLKNCGVTEVQIHKIRERLCLPPMN